MLPVRIVIKLIIFNIHLLEHFYRLTYVVLHRGCCDVTRTF